MNPPILLVYGGGKFGTIVFQKFHSTHRLLIIDNDRECAAAQLPIPKIIEKNLKVQTAQIMQTKDSCFILGDIETVVYLLDKISIDFLIPVAPIHIMKEILVSHFIQQFPSLLISEDVELALPSDLIPPELQIFSNSPQTLYLSYAKWEERCPDNCPGPTGYCRIHKRLKPISVTDLCNTAWPGPFTFIFESWQLSPGIGGIPISSIQKHFNRLKHAGTEIINSFSELNVSNRTIIIGTTCNCHGVVSAIKISNKKN